MTKKKCLLCTFGIMLILTVFTSTLYAQLPKQTFQWQGQEREYYVYIPASYNSSDRLPVMVFLHGFDGGIDSYNSSINFQQADDQFHWMIVLPQALSAQFSLFGMSIPVGNAWNSGIVMTLMGTAFTPNSDVDDAGFLLALVDELGTSYNIDSDSLFFTGFSMGAFMTHRMAIEHADRINAVAAASGLIPVCFAESTPSRHISVLHIHGTSDTFICPDGTANPIPGMGQMTLGLSVDSTISYWRHVNQCDLDAVTTDFPNTVNDGMTFALHTYGSSTDDTRVALLSVEGGEHKWYEDGHDIKYLTEIYNFFTRRQPHNTDGINAATPQIPFNVYPNPAHNTITVESPCEAELFVYDAMGCLLSEMHITNGSHILDISSYPAGMYLLRTSLGQSSQLIIK